MPAPEPRTARPSPVVPALPAQLFADCRVADHRLRRAAAAAVRPAPAITFEGYPREAPKPEVDVHEAATRIANALHLHLD